MALIATALACAALSGGCVGPPDTAAAHAPQASEAAQKPASHFAIAFERSGGLKASVETLVVRPGLRAYATAPKGDSQASAHFKMNARTAEEVRRELAKAHFAQLPSVTASGCADCYVYSIAYHDHRVRFPGSRVPEGLGEAVDALEGEVIAHLYRHVGFRPA